MKKLLLTFLILLTAIGLGFLIHKDPGYAMISYDHWIIATSIWVATASLFIVFFVFYFLIRLIKNIAAIPAALSHRRKFLNALKYQKYISQGIVSFYAGDFRQAEKYFIKLCDNPNSCANYLLAAQAAQDQQAYERRDAYLQKASLCGKEFEFSVSLSQAQFYLKSNQTDDALLILKKLYKQDSKNSAVLTALKTIYLKARSWEALKLILPQLKKQKLISAEELRNVHELTPASGAPTWC